jgi:hypothetical protein
MSLNLKGSEPVLGVNTASVSTLFLIKPCSVAYSISERKDLQPLKELALRKGHMENPTKQTVNEGPGKSCKNKTEEPLLSGTGSKVDKGT